MMQAGLRRRVLVGAVLLSLLALLWLRLDLHSLNASLEQKIARFAGAQFQAETTSLTFLHGIGLRLDKVAWQHPQYHVQADHINIAVRLLPLLLGNIEIEGMDMHHAVFTLQDTAVPLSPASIANLPLERVQLIRANIQLADGTSLFSDVHLELRDIGPNRETWWEFKARQDQQSISGHGRILFHQAELASGFGKLKLEKLALSNLQTIAPKALINWLDAGGDHLSGSLTLDISKQQRWSIFGEMLLASDATEASIKLRGKLTQPSKGEWRWRDSFVHFDAKSVLAIEGGCKQKKCTTKLDAKHVALARWTALMPESMSFPHTLSATTNLLASLQWDEYTWQGSSSLQLNNAAFSYDDNTIALPDLHLEKIQWAGNWRHQWHVDAAITASAIKGSVAIRVAQKGPDDRELFIESNDAGSELWRPLSNMLLAWLDIAPVLQASGPIKAKLHVQQQADEKQLSMEFDAGQNQLVYAPWFKKPADITAHCQADMAWSGGQLRTMTVQQCQLHSSSVEQLTWTAQQLSVDQFEVNFDQLRSQSIELPQAFTAFRGMLGGSGKLFSKNPLRKKPFNKESSIIWPDFDHMSGTWRLQNFGTDTWHGNGTVEAENGNYRSKRMLINGALGQAELQGHYDAPRQRGVIDVISGRLQWDSVSAIGQWPEFWQQLSLSGNIRNTQLTLLDNDWQGIGSGYTFAQGKLSLKKLQAVLAGGSISSSNLTLFPHSDGLRIEGDMRAKNISLQQLQGVNSWLQAELSGKLHANIELYGTIQSSELADWQRSNGDVIIYNGDWGQQKEAVSLTERLGIKTPLLQFYHFNKLAFRFRVGAEKTDISALILALHQQQYRGRASISPEFYLRGLIQNTSIKNTSDTRPYLIDSQLPKLGWKMQ